MKGYLTVNSFLSSEKFREIYRYLSNAANDEEIELQIKSSAEMTSALDGKIFCENPPDFVLFWDKDIYLAKRLEASGIKLFNSAKAVEICDDKALSALALSDADIPTPRTVISPKTFEGIGYCDLSFLDVAADILGFPMVIKEVCGSFGQQVYLAKNKQDAVDIISKIGHKSFIMQEFIGESAGRDVRVNVVGGRVVASMIRRNDNDFRSNITNGGKTEQIVLPREFEEIAIAATRAAGADFAGVDILFGKDRPLVCEINSNPHFKSTLDCTGVDVSRHIIAHVKESLK